MRILLPFIILCTIYCDCMAQGFNLPNNKISFVKDISFGTVHGYLEIESDTADTLPMTWVAKTEEGFPSAWGVNFDDQNNYYYPVFDHDSGHFNLYPNQGFAQKLIIGLAHNGAADTSSIFFTLFADHAPEDSVRIEYEFIIARELPDDTIGDTTDTTMSIQVHQARNFRLYHNSHQWVFWSTHVVGEVRIYNTLGQEVFSGHNVQAAFIDPKWTNQMLFYHVSNRGMTHSGKAGRP